MLPIIFSKESSLGKLQAGPIIVCSTLQKPYYTSGKAIQNPRRRNLSVRERVREIW